MTIRLYNARTQAVETLEPSNEAGAYACILAPARGHAGHARAILTFDVVTRHLRARGGKVTHGSTLVDPDAPEGPRHDLYCDAAEGPEEATEGKRRAEPSARYWVHAGPLLASPPDALDAARATNDVEAVRWFLLATHYRAPLSLEVTTAEGGRSIFAAIDEAERRVEYLYGTRDAVLRASEGKEPEVGNVLQAQAKTIDAAAARVLRALDQDLDTVKALAAIGELATAANEVVLQIPRLASNKAAQDSARQLAARAVQALDGSCAPLGLLESTGEAFASRTRARRLKLRGLDARVIDAKVRDRVEARRAGDFARADALRKELGALGVDVIDSGTSGSVWRVLL